MVPGDCLDTVLFFFSVYTYKIYSEFGVSLRNG